MRGNNAHNGRVPDASNAFSLDPSHDPNAESDGIGSDTKRTDGRFRLSVPFRSASILLATIPCARSLLFTGTLAGSVDSLCCQGEFWADADSTSYGERSAEEFLNVAGWNSAFLWLARLAEGEHKKGKAAYLLRNGKSGSGGFPGGAVENTRPTARDSRRRKKTRTLPTCSSRSLSMHGCTPMPRRSPRNGDH